MKKILVLNATFLLILICQAQVENVFLVTLDGYRWQELTQGIDEGILKSEFTRNPEELARRFKTHNAPLTLNPFFQGIVKEQGILLGDRRERSFVNCTNQMWFSYPGYNEILSGKADDERITSNDSFPNPNITFLEILNRRNDFKGKVAAFASWDAFDYIINEDRSGIYVNTGFENANHPNLSEAELVLNKVQHDIPKEWPTVRYDVLTHQMMMAYVQSNHPRAVYISYGETDDYAHHGEYDNYLDAAYRANLYLEELWTFIQTDKYYKNKTLLVVTTDHGRGDTTPESWKGHGRSIDRADEIWVAFMGPGNLSAKNNKGSFYQDQIAPTIMELLGIDWKKDKAIKNIIDK